MDRKPSDFSKKKFDVLIIGGGITGACIAMDASMRGLDAALIEKDDFGAATSSASSKLLHGGIRYLQQLKLNKVRESALERVYFQNLAPHLTRYIPFIIPTYSNFSKSKLLMNAAMLFYEAICVGQNRNLHDKAKIVPRSRTVSRQEIHDIVPDLSANQITGGVVFFESHMHSSERMTLSIVDTAAYNGATVANYMQAQAYLGVDNGCVTGVRVEDKLNKTEFNIRAKLVINAAGPWIPSLNQEARSRRQIDGIVNAFSKGAHIVTRPLTKNYAVALPTKQRNQTIINRGGRHVFVIPWRNCSLIGTTYGSYRGDIDAVRATENDIEEMMADINSAFGQQVLGRKDVYHAFAGLYPLTDEVINPDVYQGTGTYEIIDHAVSDAIGGLISVFGAKFTTARRVAEKALDGVAPRFDKTLGRCKTRNSSSVAGNIEDIRQYRTDKQKQYSGVLAEPIIDNLVTNYGTKIDKILELVEGNKCLGQELLPGRMILAAEILYAVRAEMAYHLEDVIFRRTGLGTLGNPGDDILVYCANLMAKELNWNDETVKKEVTHCLNAFLSAT